MRLALALAVGCSAWLASYTPVLAQKAPTQALSAEQIIERDDALGLFEPADPIDGGVVVRHMASGLACAFPRDTEGRITIFPSAEAGDDVRCESGGVWDRSIRATRRQSRDLDVMLQETVAELGAQVAPVQPAETIDAPGGAFRIAEYLVEQPTGRTRAVIIVASANGWELRQITQGLDPAMSIGAVLFWLAARGSILHADADSAPDRQQ